MSLISKEPDAGQIAASRANGARSRGPVTPEGKIRSARNSTRHGLLARAILLEGESRDRFNGLVKLLNDALKPETAIDHLLVGKMAAAHWRQVRIWNLEREGEKSLGDHEMRLDRQFFRTLDRYLKLRALAGKAQGPTDAAPNNGGTRPSGRDSAAGTCTCSSPAGAKNFSEETNL